MAFCPRSAQKIFWWLKSASRATAFRNCSTICVYSRLSSPSFRMSLRFVKIRQGSLPAMQEMELKVLPGGTSNHVGSLCWRLNKVCWACLHYECVHVHPLDIAKGLALVIKWHQAKQPSVYIKETDTKFQGASGAQLINDLSPAHNTISPTYCFTHSCAGVHLITLMTLAFVASFQVNANLTTDPRIQTLIDICNRGIECWSKKTKQLLNSMLITWKAFGK